MVDQTTIIRMIQQAFGVGGSANRFATAFAEDGRFHSAGSDPASINLRARVGSWPVRDQGNSVLCIAYAAAACLELAMALRVSSSPEAKLSTPEHLSAGFLHHEMFDTVGATPLNDRAPKWDEGGMWFTYAVDALSKAGICTADRWADTSDPRRLPTADALNSAGKRIVPNQLDCSVSNPVSKSVNPPANPSGKRSYSFTIATLNDFILEDLNNDLPVAVAFPIYANQYGVTNWTKAGEGSGTVGFPINPAADDHCGGHSVCIVGYRPDAVGDSGGWFIFRNSWGIEWAGNAPDAGGVQVPGPGYGAIAAGHVESAVWEILAPAVAP